MQQFSSMCQYLSKLFKPLVIWVGFAIFYAFISNPSKSSPVHEKMFIEFQMTVKMTEMKWKIVILSILYQNREAKKVIYY